MNIRKPWQARILRKPDDGGGSGGGAGGGDPHGSSATVGSDGKAQTVGEVAQQSQQQSSASSSVPFNVDPPKTGAFDWRKELGALADDPTIKDVKDLPGLAQRLIDTKKMVGQKTTGIPGKDAKPEEIAEFRKAMGVPEKPEDYGFAKPDGLPEKLAGIYNEEHSLKWAKRMQELGVPKEVANTIRNEYFAETIAEIGKLKDEGARTDENFEKVTTEVFGNRRDTVIKAASASIQKHVPEKLKPFVDTFDNNQLAIMAAMEEGIRKEYGGEDQVIGEELPQNSGKSVGELRQELREIMALPEYNSPFAKGKEEHERLVQKAKDLSKQISDAGQIKAKR